MKAITFPPAKTGMSTGRLSILAVPVFLVTFNSAMAGTLQVTVHNISGSTVSGARVHLYYGSGLDSTTNSSGVATFSNLNTAGTYSYEVYYTGTSWGQEYWGDDSASVTSGTTSDSFTRNMPYVNGAVTFERLDGANWVNIPQGGTVLAGAQVRAKTPTRNPNASNLSCASRVRLDRGTTSPYDYTFDVGLTAVNSGQSTTLTSQGQAISTTGTYSFAVEYLNTRLLNNNTLRTDASNWGSAFTVISNQGTLQVTVRNINNSTVSGARVHLVPPVVSDQTTNGSGVATFTGLAAGTYNYEVYYSGTSWGEEFWGDDSAVVNAGTTTSDSFTRNMPYVNGSVTLERLDGANWVNIPAGSSIVAGTQVRAKVPARNPNSNNLSCASRVRLDRDSASSYDYTFDVGLTVVNSGQTVTLTSSGQTVDITGAYSFAVDYLNTRLLNGNTTRTDAGSWSTAFTVISNQGTLQVTVRNINNSTVSGARVHLVPPVVSDQTTNGSGVATFTGLAAGTYNYEVYYSGTSWGEEFWGDDSAVVNAGTTTSDSFTRNMPYVNGSVTLERLDGANWVNIPAGSSIVAGTQVRAKVPARNPNSNNLSCASRVRLDRDSASSYDYTFDVGLTVVNSGQTVTLTSSGQTVDITGAYSFAVDYLNTRLLNGNTTRTDASGWRPAFTVEALIPIATGRVLYHCYWNPFAPPVTIEDGHVFVYDLGTGATLKVTNGLPLSYAMNAHFSPMGNLITFMAIPSGVLTPSWSDMHVYVYDLAAEQLRNGGPLHRGQDPKFSPDGTSIVFKDDGAIYTMRRDGANPRAIPILPGEKSGPNYSPDGQRLTYWRDSKCQANVFISESDGSDEVAVTVVPNLQEMYPIFWDDHRILYTRWEQADSNCGDDRYPADALYVHDLATGLSTPLPGQLNIGGYEDADPFPVASDYVGFSSNRDSGHNYLIYVGGADGSAVYPVPSMAPDLHNLGGWFSEIASDEVAADYLLAGRITDGASGDGISGVSIAFSGLGKFGLTDAIGYYAVTIPDGWTGTAMPEMNGYSFEPSIRVYNNAQGDRTREDFIGRTAALLTLVHVHQDSGTVRGGAENVNPDGPASIEARTKGITRCSIQFSEDVNIGPEDVQIRDVNDTRDEARPSTFTYDPSTFTLTMTWPDGTFVDRWVRIHVLDCVTSATTGAPLDGEIFATSGNPASGLALDGALPSGDGVAGGSAMFVLGNLIADVTGNRVVNATDRGIVQQNIGKACPEGDLPSDITGNCVVNATDRGWVQQKIGGTLPTLPVPATIDTGCTTTSFGPADGREARSLYRPVPKDSNTRGVGKNRGGLR